MSIPENLFFVNFVNRKSWPVTDINGGQILLQLVQWAPVGNAFVYVYMNDIYYRTSAREQPVQEFRLTRTGRPGTIYNGVPDWVYEGSVFFLFFSRSSMLEENSPRFPAQINLFFKLFLPHIYYSGP